MTREEECATLYRNDTMYRPMHEEHSIVVAQMRLLRFYKGPVLLDPAGRGTP